jgi:hypothetical protein
MTACFGNASNGPLGYNIDGFVYPQFIGYALRAPTTQDIYNPGTRWQNNAVSPAVQYYTTGAGNWYEYPNSSFGVSSVTGTANQVTATPTTGAVVLSIPSTFTSPGSVTATLGAITATNGNLNLATIGNKLLIATGTNASVGVSGAMAGTPGAVTVATTACTASSVILYSRATTGGTPGQVSITAQSTSGFTLTSTGNETSTFNWLIIN